MKRAWTTAALGDLVDFYSGGTPSKSKPEFWKGDIPWFSAKDMKSPRLADSIDHVSENVFTQTSLRRVPADTIAMVVRGMILAHTIPISILDRDCAINQDLKALIPRQPIDTTFLAAMIRAQHDKILSDVSRAAHGTTKLESHVLASIEVPLPPLDEQRRIAAVLNHVENLRRARRRAQVSVEHLQAALFAEKFGRRSETPIGKLLDLVRDTTKSASKIPQSEFRSTGIIPVIDQGASEIAGYTDDSDLAYSDTVPVVLFGDHTRTVKFATAPFVLGADGVKVLTPLPGMDPLFTYHAIKNIRLPSNGYSRHFKFLKEEPVPLPPLRDQEQFAERIRSLTRIEARSRRHGDRLNALFESIQLRAFAGELDVDNVRIPPA